ncbi:uncharacterized protein B0P05DRAFT_536250 [Gilbertella persicaria]|uniref:uncharacterized protein n=1 Tax=Gilbertella persicaria TaxID=101096 RepID=UPI0022203C59|nr:uncharacterized protein B0P05DRAFT_536250 [Gilbertella persicaria]KAI8084125.1 hypothetical protein B0P05DRAFT_536250 [Gilbertella persicaria]
MMASMLVKKKDVIVAYLFLSPLKMSSKGMLLLFVIRTKNKKPLYINTVVEHKKKSLCLSIYIFQLFFFQFHYWLQRVSS